MGTTNIGVGWSCSGGNAIRYQRFVALVLLNHNHSISEARILREYMFDFSQLNSEAAQLNLVVCAPDVLNIAVSPANPRVLAVIGQPTSGIGSQENIYFSSDGGQNWQKGRTIVGDDTEGSFVAGTGPVVDRPEALRAARHRWRSRPSRARGRKHDPPPQ